MSHDPTVLPAGLPVPEDDGAALHLLGAALPDLELPDTGGGRVRLSKLGEAVLFFYPRTGVPGQAPNPGFAGEEWDSIPGARGCTPQSCGFRDLHAEFAGLGVRIFGVSTNTSEHQREFKQRNRVPFEFLSDSAMALTRAVGLPTFEFPVESGGPTTLLKRMAWYVTPDAGGVARVRRVWYPVFPPDRNAAEVLAWTRRRAKVKVRPVEARDGAFVLEELTRHWGGPGIWSLGRMYRADRLPGVVGEVDGERAGLVTYIVHDGGYSFEVMTVSARREGEGVAARLLEAAVDEGRAAGCIRAFLTTTNDNMRAIEFYQRQGWRIAALHKGIIDAARERKAQIPRVGPSGLPIRDEIEMEMWLR